MMRGMSIVIPGSAAPNNLHLSDKVKTAVVEADMYNICERIKEISPRLFIIHATDGPEDQFIIMENCEDGVERLVYKTKELDARVVEKLQWMRHVPLEQRVREIEADLEKYEAEEAEKSSEDLYERMGGPMWSELDRTGFIQRPKSYPKTGVAKPGKAR